MTISTNLIENNNQENTQQLDQDVVNAVDAMEFQRNAIEVLIDIMLSMPESINKRVTLEFLKKEIEKCDDYNISLIKKPFLHYALVDENVINYLITRPFDLSMVDAQGCTVLGLALKKHTMRRTFISAVFDKLDNETIYNEFVNYKKNSFSVVNIMDIAATYGCFKFIKWFFVNHFDEFSNECLLAMGQAAEYGYLDIVKWFKNNTREHINHWNLRIVAANGHVEMVKYIVENIRPFTGKWDYDEAIKNTNNKEIINYLSAKMESNHVLPSDLTRAENEYFNAYTKKLIENYRNNEYMTCKTDHSKELVAYLLTNKNLPALIELVTCHEKRFEHVDRKLLMKEAITNAWFELIKVLN